MWVSADHTNWHHPLNAALIKTVCFHLHPSFIPSKHYARAAPFVTNSVGYAPFEVRCEITWNHPDWKSVTIAHAMSFDDYKTYRKYEFVVSNK